MEFIYKQLYYDTFYYNYEHAKITIDNANVTTCDTKNYYSLMTNLKILDLKKLTESNVPEHIKQINIRDIDDYKLQYRFDKIMGNPTDTKSKLFGKLFPVKYFSMIYINHSKYTKSEFDNAYKNALNKNKSELGKYEINMRYETYIMLPYITDFVMFVRGLFEHVDYIIESTQQYKEKTLAKTIVKIQYLSLILYFLSTHRTIVKRETINKLVDLMCDYAQLLPTSSVIYDFINNIVTSWVSIRDRRTYLITGLEQLKTTFNYNVYKNVMTILCDTLDIKMIRELYDKYNDAFVNTQTFDINIDKQQELLKKIRNILKINV